MEENVWRCCSAPSVFHHSAATLKVLLIQSSSINAIRAAKSCSDRGSNELFTYNTDVLSVTPNDSFTTVHTSLNFRLHILKTSENGYEEAANDVDPLKLLDLIPRVHFSLFSLPNSCFFRTSPEVAELALRPALFIASIMPEDQGAFSKTTQTRYISAVCRCISMPN